MTHAPTRRTVPISTFHHLDLPGVCFTADDGAGGGQGGTTPPPAATATPPQGGDVLQGLQRLIERQGGEAGRVAELLYRENHELREKNRALSGQVPGQGAVVLQGEQAAQWTAYTALGAPDALTAALTEREAATSELASLRRAAQIRAVAEASGFKASVLGQLPGAADLTFAVREVEADGKKVATAVVRDAAGTEHPLTAYASEHWADFLPALTASQGGTASQGTPFPPQQGGSGNAASPVDAFIQQSNERRDKAPNPLARK
jgi:hypothetical protein